MRNAPRPIQDAAHMFMTLYMWPALLPYFFHAITYDGCPGSDVKRYPMANFTLFNPAVHCLVSAEKKKKFMDAHCV